MLGRYKKIFLIILFITIVFTCNNSIIFGNTSIGKTYYIDSDKGNDVNDGTSISSPWKTLSKVNNYLFQPGDKILFKAGCTWICGVNEEAERLNPKGSGKESYPIIIDMYGNGPKPLIIGNDSMDSNAIYLENQHHFEINNLRVTIPGEKKPFATRKGIYIVAFAKSFPESTLENPVVLSHIYIRNCEVFSIRSDITDNSDKQKSTGGIVVNVWSKDSNDNGDTMQRDIGFVYFDDIKIENNKIDDVWKSGIFLFSSFRDSGFVGPGWRPYLPFTRVVISGNIVSNTGGDGIVACVCKSPLIEKNVCSYPHRYTAKDIFAVGIWVWNCTDPLVQYNESFGNQSNNDGQGFDVDFGNQRAIFQYNYSHDNEGGFLLLCAGVRKNVDSIVRYNLSVNDGCNAGQRIINVYGTGTVNAQIYNNTIYTSKDVKCIVDSQDGGWAGGPKSVTFKNNIFYINNPNAIWKVGKGTSISNNIIHGGIKQSFSGNIYKDPLFQYTDKWNSNVKDSQDSLFPKGIEGFKLRYGSPCIDAAKRIDNSVSKDFFSISLVNDTTDIGMSLYVKTKKSIPTNVYSLTILKKSNEKIQITLTSHYSNIPFELLYRVNNQSEISVPMPIKKGEALKTISGLKKGDVLSYQIKYTQKGVYYEGKFSVFHL